MDVGDVYAHDGSRKRQDGRVSEKKKYKILYQKTYPTASVQYLIQEQSFFYCILITLKGYEHFSQFSFMSAQGLCLAFDIDACTIHDRYDKRKKYGCIQKVKKKGKDYEGIKRRSIACYEDSDFFMKETVHLSYTISEKDKQKMQEFLSTFVGNNEEHHQEVFEQKYNAYRYDENDYQSTKTRDIFS